MFYMAQVPLRLCYFLRAVAYFCIRYFLKLGFLGGLAGFCWHFWQGLWYRWLVGGSGDWEDEEILRQAGKGHQEEGADGLLTFPPSV